MKNFKKVKKAFTLVELLVVIAILAILGTVGVVGYTAFIKKANASATLSEITQAYRYYQADVIDGVADFTNEEIESLGEDELVFMKDGVYYIVDGTTLSEYDEANVYDRLCSCNYNGIGFFRKYAEVEETVSVNSLSSNATQPQVVTQRAINTNSSNIKVIDSSTTNVGSTDKFIIYNNGELQTNSVNNVFSGYLSAKNLKTNVADKTFDTYSSTVLTVGNLNPFKFMPTDYTSEGKKVNRVLTAPLITVGSAALDDDTNDDIYLVKDGDYYTGEIQFKTAGEYNVVYDEVTTHLKVVDGYYNVDNANQLSVMTNDIMFDNFMGDADEILAQYNLDEGESTASGKKFEDFYSCLNDLDSKGKQITRGDYMNAWKKFRVQKGITTVTNDVEYLKGTNNKLIDVQGICITSDLKVTTKNFPSLLLWSEEQVEDSPDYEFTDPGDFEGTAGAKLSVVGKLKQQAIYAHKKTKFDINGNFFTIDASKVPLAYRLNNTDSFGSLAVVNASGQTDTTKVNYCSPKLFYYASSVGVNNASDISNLKLIGNAPKSENLFYAGGLTAIHAHLSNTITVKSCIINSFAIGCEIKSAYNEGMSQYDTGKYIYTPYGTANQSTNYSLDIVNDVISNCFTQALYLNCANTVNISSSCIENCGGPAFILEGNVTTSSNEQITYYHTSFLNQDDVSYVHSKCIGTEAYFTLLANSSGLGSLGVNAMITTIKDDLKTKASAYVNNDNQIDVIALEKPYDANLCNVNSVESLQTALTTPANYSESTLKSGTLARISNQVQIEDDYIYLGFVLKSF